MLPGSVRARTCAHAAALLLLLVGRTQCAVPTVHTSLGTIRGTTSADGAVELFRGIPYATIGARFTPSTPATEAWAPKTLDASAFGPVCWQAGNPGYADAPLPMAEDCLSLNVFRPAKAAAFASAHSSLPTLVWIHGGGMTTGASAIPLYDGTALARTQGVVVVSLNYRLGPLGFLAAGLNGDGRGDGGMNGQHDQINALKWVQAHIAAFGGDPGAVTVSGESAGSLSTCELAVSPLAAGLFQRAILQSGPCNSAVWGPSTPGSGAAMLACLLESTGASSAAALQDAAAFHPADFAQGWPLTCTDPATLNFTGNSVDGWVNPMPPRELWREPTNVVPTGGLLLGATTYDGLCAFLPDTIPASDADYRQGLSTRFGGDAGASAAKAVYAAYNPEEQPFGSVAAAFCNMDGDDCVLCPARELAATAAAALRRAQPRGSSSSSGGGGGGVVVGGGGSGGGGVYAYTVAHLYELDMAVQQGLVTVGANASDWTSHAGELPFVFGNSAFPLANGSHGDVPFSKAERALSDEMMTRWAAFAATGVPTGPAGSVAWKAVPVSGDGSVAHVPALLLQAGGSRMLPPDAKVDQCAAFPTLEARGPVAGSSGLLRAFSSP